ncbi:Mtr2p [Ascoidea rubescens DSM 1968]|uniref:NTF2-like protein n=1 Tax=Ascoidea rubescens DSM 1968 TaxID=1344418 RepID=A0A1D2VEA7_9ASCO|nr:NTF2-like protein [Ascoidea rubescens DSM 1968]ODV59850.1 NTF2-like protein [Ascoidea rubescens DSM 1968]
MSDQQTIAVKTLAESLVDSMDKRPLVSDLSNESSLINFKSSLFSCINNNCKIIINSNPLAAKTFLTDFFLKLPLTEHTYQSYDYHFIPSLNLISCIIVGKVKIDEYPRNKLGETADLLPPNNNYNGVIKERPFWSLPFGFTLNFVIQTDTQDIYKESIISFNYKVNYIPEETQIKV